MAETETNPCPVGRLLKRWRGIRHLSQLDLALTAGVSARHVSFVETGRAEPSRELLVRLAGALDLPLAERNALLVAAGYAPRHPARPLSSDALARVRHVLERMLDQHEPYPALALDGHWNLLLANAAFGRLLAFLEAAPAAGEAAEPPNLFLSIFDPAGLRRYLEDWEDSARMALRRAYREDAARGGDRGMQALIQRALAFPGVPRDYLVVGSADEDLPCFTFTLAHRGVRLTWFSTLTTFGTAQDVTVQGLNLESYFPADEKTERAWAGMDRPANM